VSRGARALAAALAAFLLGARTLAAADIDWRQVEREATELLVAYIRIDTSNPPGNETKATRFLAEWFEREGFTPRLLESKPGRGSIVVKLKGTGERRPLVLLHHVDVVPAVAEEWKLQPFSGTVRDGYVHGRGAIDCKGVGVIDAMALLLLKRNGIELKRDVVFVGTADEEAGGEHGAGWLIENHARELGDIEFVLNEGGHIRSEGGKRLYEVSVAEKTPCWLRLTAHGKSGHGSTPPEQTATTRLVRALDRIVARAAEVKVVPEVQAYYAALAATEEEPRKTRFADLRASLDDAEFRRQFLADARDAALVRNTLVPTVLSGSPKTNIIPATATAELDCRLLPGESPDEFVRSIQHSIDDKDVDVDILLNFPPSSSPVDTDLFRAISAVAGGEKTAVVPAVLRGFTDSHFFRERGIASYGFTPFELTPDDLGRVHGIDERIATADLREATRRLLQILRLLDE
jgi:acetylornithine deacetylase/succinyl-diaminopimelate desuccinylase-like protein